MDPRTSVFFLQKDLISTTSTSKLLEFIVEEAGQITSISCDLCHLGILGDQTINKARYNN